MIVFHPDTFNVREEAFLFIEGIVARSFPDWVTKYRHWGVTWVARETWIEILSRFPELRRYIRRNTRLRAVVRKHVTSLALLRYAQPEGLPETSVRKP
jgi:hypothetical protein